MKLISKIRRYGPLALALILLAIGGCIVSGTFMIIKPFHLTTYNGKIFYYTVDITTEQEWKDHRDEINEVKTVGFELWITNNEAFPVAFEVYVDEYGQPEYDNADDIEAYPTQVVGNLELAAGPGAQTHISYGDSFGHLMNVKKLKQLVESGKLHFYGLSSGGTSSGFFVDSGKVIVTLSAGS